MSESRLARAVLLETCAVISLANGDVLAADAIAAIVHAGTEDGVFVSPISAWEVGMLSRPRAGRSAALRFLPDPKTWFAPVMAGSGINEAALTPAIASTPLSSPAICTAIPAIDCSSPRLVISACRS